MLEFDTHLTDVAYALLCRRGGEWDARRCAHDQQACDTKGPQYWQSHGGHQRQAPKLGKSMATLTYYCIKASASGRELELDLVPWEPEG